MKVKLISKPEPMIEGIENAEQLICYAARVSNPTNQLNVDTADKLLGYCWKHKHWSIFEQADFTMEIETSRAIAAQILRHRSFVFQEFSQRYSKATELEDVNLRKQDLKNRQNSTNDLDPKIKETLEYKIAELEALALDTYEELLDNNVAKECARMILPLSTTTRLYMKGNMRSWITYCITRCEKGTQKEHRDIAIKCWKILKQQCPNIAKFVEEEYVYLKEDS